MKTTAGPVRLASILMLVVLVAGCAKPVNPSFDLSVRQAKRDLRAMRADRKVPERPIVVAAGWGDPGFRSTHVSMAIERVLDDERIERVVFTGGMKTFDMCRERMIGEVESAFPSDDPEWTTEVDVVATSMGGLVARYAAIPREGEKTLRIRRLMTIGTPHQGASMASVPVGGKIVRDMRVGSDFITELNRQPIEYELIPYARLGDTWVGHEYTAPPGEFPWWVANKWLSLAHIGSSKDQRILADIARRLRGETPYTTLPRAPFPE